MTLFSELHLLFTIFAFSAAVTYPRPPSCHEVRQIVDRHNYYRLAAARNMLRYQPKAANMHVLAWDKGLAAKAQLHANRGVCAHNPERKDVLGRFITGENIYWKSITTWDTALDLVGVVDSWVAEVANFTYTRIGDIPLATVGHYTQMMWAKTTFVGCGISVTYNGPFDWYYLIICNYGPTGNVWGQHPYETGAGCERLCCALPACTDLYGGC